MKRIALVIACLTFFPLVDAAEAAKVADALPPPPCKFARVPMVKITDARSREFVLTNVQITFSYASGDLVLPKQAFHCQDGNGEVDLPFDQVSTLRHIRHINSDYRLFEARLCNGQIRNLRIRNDRITFRGTCNSVKEVIEVNFADVRRLIVGTPSE